MEKPIRSVRSAIALMTSSWTIYTVVLTTIINSAISNAGATCRPGRMLSCRHATNFAGRKVFCGRTRLSLRSISVSRMTDMGIIRLARRSGSQLDSRMTSMDSASTGSSSHHDGLNRNSVGAACSSAHAAPQPASIASGDTISASSSASRPKMRRICFFVAPTARSMPISETLRESWLSIAPAIPTQVASSSAPASTPMQTV